MTNCIENDNPLSEFQVDPRLRSLGGGKHF